MSDKPTVLIVDDNLNNLSLLYDYLKNIHIKVFIAENGESALKRLEYIKPDLILLDILMPGIDGFETCRQLKQNPETKDIPVLFITALTETVNKVNGFKLGAVDYITKPFQQEEVLARIQTHLTLHKLQKEQKIKTEQLFKLNQEKDEFLGIVAHDLKNPLSATLSVIELITSHYDQISKTKMTKILNELSISSKRGLVLIEKLLNINAMESGKMKIFLQNINILLIVQHIVEEYSDKAEAKNITLQFNKQNKSYLAFVDENYFFQIIENLISNAIKYSPHGKSINIRLILNDNAVRCAIEDEGPGISDSEQKKLFGKFSRLTPQPTGDECSTGLGLFIVKKLVEAQNGKVWCESDLGNGSTFIVEFPIVNSKS